MVAKIAFVLSIVAFGIALYTKITNRKNSGKRK